MTFLFCNDTGCHARADFRCESRKVGEQRRVKSGTTERIVQPYTEFHLCAEHCRQALVSDDPPRAVHPLPHYKPPATATAAAAPEQPRLGDWGTP